MKTLEDFKGKLTDYTEKEQKEILNVFVNELIMDLNAPLTGDEIIHLQFRVHSNLNTSMQMKYLIKIRTEILTNYKRYIPLCFASILTACKNI